MLAKEVLRNSMDLNRRIKEQSVIYQDWKAMAMEIDEDEIHEIVEAAWDDLIASIRLKRKLEELIMANHNADQRGLGEGTIPKSIEKTLCRNHRELQRL